MTFEEVRARNDKLRTTFTGGRIIMTLDVWSLPAQLRGQAIYHMAQYNSFHSDSDHSEGVFIWQGVVFHWYVGEFAGDLTITLATGGGT
jgi:hypothetical protein